MPKKKRDYKKEYARDQSSEKAKKDRAARNKARRQAIKAKKVRKGDGKEIDHIKPLKKGGSRNDKSNLRIVTRHANRVKAAK